MANLRSRAQHLKFENPELARALFNILKNSDEYKTIPVIYFSANNDIQLLARNAGADSFLAKPFDIEELERVINQVMVA